MHHMKKIILVLLVGGSFSSVWSQPGSEFVQTQSAKEVEDQRVDNVSVSKVIDLEGQWVQGEMIFDPNIWVMDIQQGEIPINLDRDFSDYLVANLDRETIEYGNHEN